jgi:hypothetical protein
MNESYRREDFLLSSSFGTFIISHNAETVDGFDRFRRIDPPIVNKARLYGKCLEGRIIMFLPWLLKDITTFKIIS